MLESCCYMWVLLHWWSNEKRRERWWERWRGGKRYDPIGGSQIKPNYVERNSPFLRSPFSLSLPPVLSSSLLKDVGSGSANGLWLFVYVQFVRGLAPFPLFKEAIYNSIHVYLPHSDSNTHSYGPRAWFSLRAFTKCEHSYVNAIQRGEDIIALLSIMVYKGVKRGVVLKW